VAPVTRCRAAGHSGDSCNSAIISTWRRFFSSRPPASSPAGGLSMGPPSPDSGPFFSERVLAHSEKSLWEFSSAIFAQGTRARCDSGHTCDICVCTCGKVARGARVAQSHRERRRHGPAIAMATPRIRSSHFAEVEQHATRALTFSSSPRLLLSPALSQPWPPLRPSPAWVAAAVRWPRLRARPLPWQGEARAAARS
jgi:hypothetical protein